MSSATLPPNRYNRDRADDVGAAAALARLASASDRPQELLERAAAQLDRPLGLAGPNGEPLACSADAGDDALALACDVATGERAGLAGWSVLPVEDLGHLAVGPAPPTTPRSPAFIDLLRSLLAGQLQRGRLRDEERAKRRSGFVLCLVRDPDPDPATASRHAAAIGIRLAEAYRVGLLVWPGSADPAALPGLQIEAARRDPGCLTVPLEGRLLVLHPGGAGPDHTWLRALEGLVAFARTSGCGAVQAVAGRSGVPLRELRAEVNELLGLSRVMDGPADLDASVVRAERFGLERLLRRGLETRAAAAFVEAELGPLVAWDARHGDDLLAVLEAALDCAHYGDAARRCHMHRNTFRQHLRRACELLGEPLEDPRRRLALHVALTLRRLLSPDGAHSGHGSKSTSERAPRGGRVSSSTFAIAPSGTMTARGARTSPSTGTSSS